MKLKEKRKGKSIRKDDHDSSVDEEPEMIVTKEDMMKKHMPPPFPQALYGKKGTNNASKIFEVLRQVKYPFTRHDQTSANIYKILEGRVHYKERVKCEQECLLD